MLGFCLGSYLRLWLLLLYHEIQAKFQFPMVVHKYNCVFLLPSSAHGHGHTRKCEDGKNPLPSHTKLGRIKEFKSRLTCLFAYISKMKL